MNEREKKNGTKVLEDAMVRGRALENRKKGRRTWYPRLLDHFMSTQYRISIASDALPQHPPTLQSSLLESISMPMTTLPPTFDDQKAVAWREPRSILQYH